MIRGGIRHFSIGRHRRYDPDELAKCLRQLGWNEIERLPYGVKDKTDIMLIPDANIGAVASP